jgi:hypothetical protein
MKELKPRANIRDLTSGKAFKAEGAAIRAALSEIESGYFNFMQSAQERALKVGELLVKVNEELEKGDWLDWLAENTPLEPRTAQRYMHKFRVENGLPIRQPCRIGSVQVVEDQLLKNFDGKNDVAYRQSKNTQISAQKEAVEVEKKPRVMAAISVAPPPPKSDLKRAPIRRDEEGWPIPASILGLWERSNAEALRLTAIVSDLRCLIRKAKDDDVAEFREICFGATLPHLDSVYTALTAIKPYAVCTVCQGLKPSACKFCSGRGFISKLLWPTVPREIVAIRKKQLEDA